MKNGGLGDSISQLLIEKIPTPMKIVAIDDKFGESGKPEELLTKYKINTEHIIEAALQLFK